MILSGSFNHRRNAKSIKTKSMPFEASPISQTVIFGVQQSTKLCLILSVGWMGAVVELEYATA